jgi:hypothetical protein
MFPQFDCVALKLSKSLALACDFTHTLVHLP